MSKAKHAPTPPPINCHPIHGNTRDKKSPVEPLQHVYRVGGYVRDTLLGLPAPDQDWVVVGETIHTMQSRGFVQVGAAFPVFLHPDTQEAYALARKEQKTGKGYRGFTTHFGIETTLEEDLARRDLTINAMAMDTKGGIIDPFEGQKDLDKRLLRHVSPAFSEDPLRVLRVARFLARFWALGFRVATETIQLMTDLVHAGEMETLTTERVWLETLKALETEHPLPFFDLLQQCGALAILFPELEALKGVPQPPTHHPEGDVWTHTRMTLMQATRLTSNPIVRFAALVHDLGKGTTPQTLLPQHHNHEERGATLVEQLCDRLHTPTHFRKLAVLTARYHTQCHRIQEMTPKKVIQLLLHLNAFRDPEILEKFLLACQADNRGRWGAEKKPYPQADVLRRCLQQCTNIDKQPILDAGLQGKRFGDALHKIRIHQVRAVLRLRPV